MGIAGLLGPTIERNSDFDLSSYIEDANGAKAVVSEARAQVRRTKTATMVLLDKSSAGGGPYITLDEDNSLVSIHIPASVTADIRWLSAW